MRQAISILAPSGRDASVIQGILTTAEVASVIAPALDDALTDLDAGRTGALVLAEEALGPRETKALKTWLGRQPSWSDLPILLLSRRRGTESSTVSPPIWMGQVTVLERPFHATTLIVAARSAMRTRERQRAAEAHLALVETQRQALQEERDRTRRYLDVAGVMLLVLDRDAVVREINPHGVRILGYGDAEAILGRDWFDLAFAPDEGERMRAAYRALMAGERPDLPDHDDLILRPDGDRRCIAWRHSVLRDAAGNPTGTLSSGEDITQRQAAEEELRDLARTLEVRVEARTAELRASEARFRGLFDSSFQFAALLSPNGIVEEVNRTALSWSRIEADTLVGKPFWDAPPMRASRKVRAEVRSAVLRAAAGAIVRRELELAGAGEDRALVDFSMKPILGDDGQILALVAEGRDVTEFRQAQASLHERAKIETLGQLTGGVAHDFNNLLTPIVGALDIIDRRTTLEPRLDALLKGAQQSADRAATLVQRLLSFARRQHLEARTVDVAQLVRGMEELVRRSVGPQVQISVVTQDGVAPAFIDPNQLELAILNLAVNARDALPDGGEMRLRVGEETADDGHPAGLPAGRYVTVSVRDTGQGMDAATLRRAIEPFFTTKDQGKGTGLGLSMVHGLAAQSGGALVMTSEPGRGTEAEIWLPVSWDETASVDDAPSRPIPVARPSRLLLVDDEPLVRSATAEMLTELGHTVVQAQSAGEALDILDRDSAIEGLVTDHLMPDVRGSTLIAGARARRPELPALLVTGFADDIQDLEPGSFARLAKPFTARALALELSRLFPAKTSA